MISMQGKTPRKIKSFCYIDRCAEGLGRCYPKEGQEFLGYPYGWLSDNSEPFISVMENGKETQTVNALDCSCIEFEIEKES